MPDTRTDRKQTGKAAGGTTARGKQVPELIKDLESKDGIRRQQARWELVRRKEASVKPLLEALKSDHDQTRWEAAKALSALAPPRAADALVAAMQDEEWDVRWVASEAVAALGRAALPVLLDALMGKPESAWLREGAHHVVHDLAGSEASDAESELLRALGEFGSANEVVETARRLRAELERHQ